MLSNDPNIGQTCIILPLAGPTMVCPLEGEFLFFFFISLQFLLPTQTSTIMWSFCVFCSFFFDLITPNLARVLIRCIFVTVNKLNFLHHLSESSSKCRSPEINCGLMSDWECTRNWNQT